MRGPSFKSAFEVDEKRYVKHDMYAFNPGSSAALTVLPSLSELVGILKFDPDEHERIWQFASDGVVPNVTLDVRASYDPVGASEKITFTVDTGAFTTTLCEMSAVGLRIDRTLRKGEVLKLASGRGAGGETIVGVHRWISVGLGGVFQQIPVLVPPKASDQRVLDQQRARDGLPVGLPPKSNLLGMAQTLGNFLLCLDQHNLYAFRDVFSYRQRYTSRAFAKFRGR